jgi:hypothetical protein
MPMVNDSASGNDSHEFRTDSAARLCGRARSSAPVPTWPGAGSNAPRHSSAARTRAGRMDLTVMWITVRERCNSQRRFDVQMVVDPAEPNTRTRHA